MILFKNANLSTVIIIAHMNLNVNRIYKFLNYNKLMIWIYHL